MRSEIYFLANGWHAKDVIDHIDSEYEVDLLGRDRDRYTSDLRKMCCNYLYTNSRLTLEQISELLGKSIGNISYYLSSHTKQMGESLAYADRYADFQDRFKEESAQN